MGSINPDGDSSIPNRGDLYIFGLQSRDLRRRVSRIRSHGALPRKFSNIIDISASQINRRTETEIFLQLPLLPIHRGGSEKYLDPVWVQGAHRNGID